MGRIILFAQQKGGAGKTMLLTQVAAAAAGRGAAVAIVDLDPQRSASAWHATRRKLFGGDAGVKLVESGNWRAVTDVRRASVARDLTLIDSPGTAEVLRKVILGVTDFCVIPCQPSAPDVWACKNTLQIIKAAGVPHCVVLNRVPTRSRAARAAEAELARLGAPVIETTIGTRAAFADAFARGMGATETAPHSKAAAEITALAMALMRGSAPGVAAQANG